MEKLKDTYKRITEKDWQSKAVDSEVYKRLAELEDKIDAGLIYEVPCEDWYPKYFIEETPCGQLQIASTHHWEWVTLALITGKDIISCDGTQLFNYGYDMFDTEEEAEQALKIIKGNSNE